jgi:type IV fimbrial biogenesis protein FimT
MRKDRGSVSVILWTGGLRMHRHSGFTLIELMTVIAIIAILSCITIPNFISWLPKYRLGSAARDLLSAMQYGRLTAVKDNADVQVKFYPDQDNYRVFADYDGDQDQDAGEPTIKSGKMPAGVSLKETNFVGNTFHFDGRGLASGSGGTISLENSSKNQTQIKVNRTGNSRILVED